MKIVRRQFLRVIGAATVAPLFSRIARTRDRTGDRGELNVEQVDGCICSGVPVSPA